MDKVKVESINVKEGNKEMTVVVASDDRQELEYLKEAEREKTSDELKSKPDKKQLTKKETKERKEAVKEYNDWLLKKKNGTGNKRIFGGFDKSELG
jgi:hypothetical protein